MILLFYRALNQIPSPYQPPNAVYSTFPPLSCAMRTIIIILCLILTSCGQKGPLYPPEPNTERVKDGA
ncbi:MAG: LPS translocon maturation chaperone LptM [Pseudomonadales bacterium]